MATLVQLRDAIAGEFPDRAHDFTWMRKLAIERALVAAGDDPALAEPAFECFFRWRQQVVLFSDASENTWKPPLSVSMACFQPMKRGVPPKRSMSSGPGRSQR